MRFEPILVVRDCFLHEPIELSDGVVAKPLREPLGFRGEIDFLFGLHLDLGLAPFRRTFKLQTLAAVANEQPTALIEFSAVEADSGELAEVQVREGVIRAASVLAWLTANPVEPIALVMRRGTDASIRPLPSQWSRLRHLNGYLDVVGAVSEVCREDARLSLMLEVLREAMGITIDFQGGHPRGFNSRLLLFGQLLEVACGDLDDRDLWDRGENTLANRLRRRLSELGLEQQAESLCNVLAIGIPEDKDAFDLIAGVRHALAHRGDLALAEHEFVAALANRRDILDRELRELVRAVIASWPMWVGGGEGTSR